MAKLTDDENLGDGRRRSVLIAVETWGASREELRPDLGEAFDQVLADGLIAPETRYVLTDAGRIALEEGSHNASS